MDALAVLRLSVSPRGSNHHGYVEDDVDEIALPTPYTSAPSSPRRAFSKEVKEAPLGEVRAAIPFAWELVPGTPKSEGLDLPSVCVYYDETEETVDNGSSASSSETTSTESLSRESSNSEFEFSSRFVDPAAPAPAEELFSNGQLVTSLRLPPRLQYLRNSDSSCSDVSSSGSFKSFSSPQSPRPGSLKLSSSLCGFSKTTDEETTILGMQERKHRSLSPLRLLNRETYFSSDSSNSSMSSSSSASSTNAGSPQNSPAEKSSVQGSMLKDLLFTDMAMASGNLKPFQVQSKLEVLKKDQEKWNGFADTEKLGKPALTPQLSRSNARSRPASIDIHVNSSRRENIGRTIFANRFGILGSCLGMLPESP